MQIKESLEYGDLKRLIHTELHIDEFKSKLGDDKDIIVVSFKISGKEPANDLVNFVEKGYDWVVDSDASSGEMDDGDYIVFVELPRDHHAPKRIMELMQDIMNLTEQKTSEWRVRYHKEQTDQDLDVDSLTSMLPLSPKDYESRFGKQDLDKLKTAAGIKVTTKAPKNDHTESLRIAAGII